MSVIKRGECNTLKWVEHVERMGEERLVKSARSGERGK